MERVTSPEIVDIGVSEPVVIAKVEEADEETEEEEEVHELQKPAESQTADSAYGGTVTEGTNLRPQLRPPPPATNGGRLPRGEALRPPPPPPPRWQHRQQPPMINMAQQPQQQLQQPLTARRFDYIDKGGVMMTQSKVS